MSRRRFKAPKRYLAGVFLLIASLIIVTISTIFVKPAYADGEYSVYNATSTIMAEFHAKLTGTAPNSATDPLVYCLNMDRTQPSSTEGISGYTKTSQASDSQVKFSYCE